MHLLPSVPDASQRKGAGACTGPPHANAPACEQVVQWLTDMGLNVWRARISSDGGWFSDEFVVDRIDSVDVTQDAIK